MSYFVDKEKAQVGAVPLGSFHVLAISSIKTMPKKDRNYRGQFHREIVLPHRSFILCCDSEHILNKWIDAINDHVRYTRAGSGTVMAGSTKQVGMCRRDQRCGSTVVCTEGDAPSSHPDQAIVVKGGNVEKHLASMECALFLQAQLREGGIADPLIALEEALHGSRRQGVDARSPRSPRRSPTRAISGDTIKHID